MKPKTGWLDLALAAWMLACWAWALWVVSAKFLLR